MGLLEQLFARNNAPAKAVGGVSGSVSAMENMFSEKAPEPTIQETISKYFPDVATNQAITASIDHETGGSFDYAQKQDGGGPGYGLFQMEGKMLDAYKGYIGDSGLEDSADSQLGFMRTILEGGKVYDIGAGHRKKMKEAMASGDPTVILKEFTDRVERPGIPHMDKRFEALHKLIK